MIRQYMYNSVYLELSVNVRDIDDMTIMNQPSGCQR